MSGAIESTSGRRGRIPYVLVFAALCAAIVAGVAVSSAGARNAKVLGKTRHTPDPACPKSPCEAVGSVTGFQTVANGEKRPFRVRKDGKLVAWAVDLSRPNKSQRNFFGKFYRSSRFGTKPTARLAVLKRKGRREYRLLRQSPVVKLSGALGQKQVFTLDRPLRIRRGNIVALTIPTWASAFAVGLSASGNQWRASRVHGRCSGNRDIRRSRPHQREDTSREYGCRYKTARLLYWGYYVRD